MRIATLVLGDTPLMHRTHAVLDKHWLEPKGSLRFESVHLKDWTPDSLLASMTDLRPKVVINGQHINSNNPDAFVSNSRDPAIVSLFSRMVGAKFFHVSDAMVFPGRSIQGAEDAPYPTKVFGLSRMLGEKAALTMHSDVTIVRVGWLYGPEIPESPPMIAVAHARKERSSASIYSDLIGSPTFIGDAAMELARKAVRAVYTIETIGNATVHMSPTWIGSWAQYLADDYPDITPASVRGKNFRDLHRNAGLIPTPDWVIPHDGLQRFKEELRGQEKD